MALQWAHSQGGVVGTLVDVTLPSGDTGKALILGVVPTDETGAPLGTAANPLVTSSGAAPAGGTIVHGPDATGVAPTQAPVFVAGIDTNGNIAPIKTVAGLIQTISEQMQGQPTSAFATIIAGMTDDDATALPFVTDGNGYLYAKAPPATWANHSGTVTTGGTSQALMPANAVRRGFWVQNNSAGDLWIMDGAAATQAQPSIRIQPGDLYESPANGCPGTAINIIGATTGQAFSAREF